MSEISIGPPGAEGAGIAIEPDRGPGIIARFVEVLFPNQKERQRQDDEMAIRALRLRHA